MDFPDKIKKFEKFLKDSGDQRKVLCQSLALIERLKEDLQYSRNIENNLRAQLSHAQSRVVSLQKNLNELHSVKGKISEQGSAHESLLLKIEELSQTVFELKEKVHCKIISTVSDKELLSKINVLQTQIKERDDKYYLLRMEHQAGIKENAKLKEKLANCNNEIEESKLEMNIIRNDLDNVKSMYGRKILELEQKLQQEAHINQVTGPAANLPKTTLERFEKDIRNLWDKKVNVTWADAARKVAAQRQIKPKKRSDILQYNEVTSEGSENLNTSTIEPSEENGISHREIMQKHEPPTSTFKFTPKFKMPRLPSTVGSVSTPNFNVVAEPLDIQPGSDKSQPKRKRLFSNNANNFI